MKNLSEVLRRMGLEMAKVQAISCAFRQKQYGKNEFLLREGQIADKVFFIESGSITMGIELDGRSFTRHLAIEGEFVTCLQSFAQQTPSTEFLKATEVSEVYAIKKHDFEGILNDHSEVKTYYEQAIFNTLIQCQRRITDLISLDAKTYYAGILQKNPDYLMRMPQYDLASYMGIEPQSLSRLRKDIN